MRAGYWRAWPIRLGVSVDVGERGYGGSSLNRNYLTNNLCTVENAAYSNINDLEGDRHPAPNIVNCTVDRGSLASPSGARRR